MTPFDPQSADPLHVPDDPRVPRHEPLRPRRPWGCALAVLASLAFWAVVVLILLLLAAPRAAADPTSSAPPDVSAVRLAASGTLLPGAPQVASGVATPSYPSLVAVTSGASRPPALGAPSPAPVVGNATWYRYRPGEAAAGPVLRSFLGPHWRGQRVTVCATTCVTVRLTDFMVSSASLVDLDRRSFAVLAPLSQGVIAVQVYVGPTPTAPPTDTGGDR